MRSSRTSPRGPRLSTRLASLDAAVPGDRRDADQAGDLAPVDGAELGQLGEQRGRQDQADPRHAGEQGEAAGEAGRAIDGAAQQRLDLGLVAPQPGEIGLRACPQRGRLDGLQLLLPGGDLADQTLAESQQLAKARAQQRPAPASPAAGRTRRSGRSPQHRLGRSPGSGCAGPRTSLASRPLALAKSRTRLALTIATARPRSSRCRCVRRS